MLDEGRAIREIVSALRSDADPTRATKDKAYLKSDLRHLGVSVPAIRRMAKNFRRTHQGLARREVIGLVEALWDEPLHERRMIAVELLDLYGPVLRERDLCLIERFIRESKTWALVDGLAVTVTGALVERFPQLGTMLDRWAGDDDFWVRRSALLALLPGLRRGEGDFRRLTRYADAMLEEREFFIRKAIGWVLRETGKKRPDRVARWLTPRAGRASGVTVREAVKHLTPEQRERILRPRSDRR